MKRGLWAWLLLCMTACKSPLPPPPVGSTGASEESKENMGKELRLMMLTTSPTQMKLSPSDEFPYVCGVLMDWPLKEGFMTVFATSYGTASLYTTGSFGIIGGENHEDVRKAAKLFVREANRFYKPAKLVASYPYPSPDKVRFYLLTYEGVRMTETSLAAIMNGESDYSRLAALGQDVLTALRLHAEKKLEKPAP